MPRRAKPSNVALTEFIEQYLLNKSQRQELIEVILKQYKKFPAKQRDLDMLAKSKLREKGIVPVSEEEMVLLQEEVQKIRVSIDKISEKLPETLILNGEERDNVYIDENDHELCRSFFKQLEEAAENYIQDLKFDAIRPQKSEVIERLRLLKVACAPLEYELLNIDDASRVFLEQHLQISVTQLSSQLGDVKSAYELSKAIDAGKSNLAKTQLCLSIAKAILNLGLRPSSSREGLLEQFMKKLIFLINKVDARQIHKNIEVALTMLR